MRKLSEKEYQLLKKGGFLELFKITRGLKDGEITIQIENGKPILPITSSNLYKTINYIVVYGNKKIYDRTYNKMKMLLTKDSFLKEIEKIRENYNIPSTGFDGLKKTKDFKRWSDEMEEKFRPVKEKVQFVKINSQTKQVEERSKSVYFSKFEESLADTIELLILKKFHLNEDFLEPMRWLILHNNLEYATNSFEMVLKQNQKGKNELWLKILPHTKKRDIIQLWDRIKLFQQYLPNYRGKLKEWTTIERDYKIYNLYKKYRRELGLRKRAENLTNLLEGKQPIDHYIYSKISKKYTNISLSNIRKIISRFKKKFSDT